MEDPWKVLGLPRGATKLEVKEAYMKLAQQLHPDKNMDLNHEQRLISEARFKTVQHAYNYLSGKERFTQIHVPARWAEAEAAAAAEMQKAVFTNRQAALWVTGKCARSGHPCFARTTPDPLLRGV
jgi:DnaJ-class molecular chaperone